MNFTRVWAFALLLVGIGLGAGTAAARSVPHTPHHAKSAEAEPHRTAGRHAAAARSSKLATRSAARSTTARATAPRSSRLAARSTAVRARNGRAGATRAERNAARAERNTPRAGRNTTRADRKMASSRYGIRLTRRGNARAALRRAAFNTRRPRFEEQFTANSFANRNIFEGDVTAGEDPVVRQAAIDALSGMNGTAVIIDPSNGRILAMVNQRLALSPGAEPCSTIKITVAMAALSEGLVTRSTPVQLPGMRMNMTEALAHSNNVYFETLGRKLGFERVHHYARQFGLGELAGYRIPGEQLGTYPDHELPASQGGVGRMCSFGQGVSMTPLQLGAYVSAVANGGTLYYLQHPRSAAEVAAFRPKVKRNLNIRRYIPDLEDGMAGAVEYGTARKLRTNFRELPVFGKTGTCSDKGTRFGWFVSYSDSPQGSLVTVFFLEGGRPVFGPRAAELTGVFYKNLWSHNWFATQGRQNAALTLPAISEQY
jgi:penicillin-binding protein 2